jgi:hypothetical protein
MGTEELLVKGFVPMFSFKRKEWDGLTAEQRKTIVDRYTELAMEKRRELRGESEIFEEKQKIFLCFR